MWSTGCSSKTCVLDQPGLSNSPSKDALFSMQHIVIFWRIMNAIVYSFIHSINHPTIQQTFIDSKCLFTRHFLTTKDAKINRRPNPTTWFPHVGQETIPFNKQGREGERERVELKKKKKNCCNCQLVLKEWPHKWSHVYRKWKKKNVLTFCLKNYEKVMCGFFPALLLLFSIFLQNLTV